DIDPLQSKLRPRLPPAIVVASVEEGPADESEAIEATMEEAVMHKRGTREARRECGTRRNCGTRRECGTRHWHGAEATRAHWHRAAPPHGVPPHPPTHAPSAAHPHPAPHSMTPAHSHSPAHAMSTAHSATHAHSTAPHSTAPGKGR